MNSKLVLILLQGARWCIQHARAHLEQRMSYGWNPAVSLGLDRLLVTEELIEESLAVSRNA